MAFGFGFGFGFSRLFNALFSPLSLFANGEPGAWYDPSDLTTLFQDSAGTTAVTSVEQPVGLMLDKSKGLVLGSELVTNGDFSAGATGWTLGTGWSVSGGLATKTPGVASQIEFPSAAVVAGRWYQVQISITLVAGTYRVRLGGQNIFSGVTTQNVSGYYLSSGTLGFSVQGEATFQGSIDNISVKELPGNHAFQATSASRPVLSARVNLLTKTEQFDDAAWTAVGITVTANTTIAPDGTLTADTITSAATNVSTNAQQFVTKIIGQTYNFSVYVKRGNVNRLLLTQQYGSGSYSDNIFDLTTLTWTTTGAGSPLLAYVAAGNGWYKISCTITAVDTFFSRSIVGPLNSNGTAFNNTTTGNTLLVWGADLRVSNDGVGIPSYQRVNTSTDYDTSGFPTYLKFDGVDDSMATGTITPGTNKAQVFAGVRKLSDAARGMLVELSATSASNNGSFGMTAPNAASATYAFESKGTTLTDAVGTPFTAPITSVLTGLAEISTDSNILRVSGVQADSDIGDQGTGNYLAYPLYIGRRGGSSLPFNGGLYPLIVRFGPTLTADQITQTETYVNSKTKAYT